MYSVGLDVDTFVSISNENWSEKIMLYAGKILLKDLNANILLESKNQSAGNLSSSNTNLLNCETNRIISDHFTHKKFKSDNDFGYYLAGLIESDGYFGNSKLEIVLHEKDKPLALYLKEYLGYGLIYQIKNKKAIKFVIRKKSALIRVLDLCNGKFVTPYKINQLKNQKWVSAALLLPPLLHISLSNPWLAGFIDADGS